MKLMKSRKEVDGKMIRKLYCKILVLICFISYGESVPIDYCLHPLDKSDCGLKPTPVFSYYKPGSRCEIELWRGCPTFNKFDNEVLCSHHCIAKMWDKTDDNEDFHIMADFIGYKDGEIDLKNELQMLPIDDVQAIDDILDNFIADNTTESTTEYLIAQLKMIITEAATEKVTTEPEKAVEAVETTIENVNTTSETTSETGETTSETGETTSETGETTSETGEITSEIAETTSKIIETTSEVLDTTTTETTTTLDTKSATEETSTITTTIEGTGSAEEVLTPD